MTTTALIFLEATARVLASTEDYGLVHMDMPAGEMPPLHVHRDEDEGFYCLGGEITLYLPGESVTLRAGDFILAPRGIPHSYEVGADGARVLVSSTPGGFERFVIAVAALDELGPEILGRVAGEHGIEILGPPGARP
jgi:quercetin dioxygenase-like cupin family protein